MQLCESVGGVYWGCWEREREREKNQKAHLVTDKRLEGVEETFEVLARCPRIFAFESPNLIEEDEPKIGNRLSFTPKARFPFLMKVE